MSKDTVKLWKKANPEKVLEHRRTYQRKWLKSIKDKIFNHYGSKCICCEERNRLFLTIDHINNDGYMYRKNIKTSGNNFFKWIVKNNFPLDLQILCYNCNCGKARNKGICPHKSS